MYYLEKTLEVAGSHSLDRLDYESKCQNLHGHNWIITVYCRAKGLNKNGMIIDFSAIKAVVNRLDHAHINQIVEQPTAENIAKWIYDNVDFCYKVRIQESIGNVVIYEE